MSLLNKHSSVSSKIQKIIDYYQFDEVPVEGTLYKSTYVSKLANIDGTPLGTAIIGLYCAEPESRSTFHRLKQDEVWHFYDGDPFVLHLFHENGAYQKVIMGKDILDGQKVQFVVPANVWQAGELVSGSSYALYGCTLAPGFTGACFEGAVAKELIQSYPDHKQLIQRLTPHEGDTHLPEGFMQ